MSTELSAEVVVEEPVDPIMNKIREQVTLGKVVRDYLDAADNFKSANNDFNKSCLAVSEIIQPSITIVISGGYGRHYGKHYLLKSDNEGNFEVALVEVI